MKERREDAASHDGHDHHEGDRAPPDATRGAMAAWSSDQGGGAVAPGTGHGAAHGGAMALWSADQGGASGVAAAPAGLFEKVAALPGDLLVSVKVEAALLPPDMAVLLGVQGTVEAEVSLALEGGTLAVVARAGTEMIVAKVDLARVLQLLAGPAGEELAALLPKVEDFVASAAGRFRAAGGTRVKIHLWGDAKDESFVVIDLARALRGAWAGNAGGLRPVEARLATKAGRIEQFGGDQVTMGSALPPADTALGDLDVVAPALRKDVLGLDDDAPVHATVYYRKGKLAVAIKPEAAATTGVVAELDLKYLLNKLKALGEKVAKFLDGLLPKFEGDDRSWLGWDLGALRFDLGGLNFFSFDFRALLPKLGGSGNFDLSGLWPTTWRFDFPDIGGLSLGSLPKLEAPWAKWPKLGSFDVNLERLTGLFSGLGLPKLPSLPSIDFDLHFKGLDLGLALDLGKLWPDLDWGKGGPSTFGIDLDLSKVLDLAAKVGGAIAKAAKWLLAKLRAAGDAIARWIHLGQDGVLRIFDGNAADPGKTSMLGFSLLRLLDGAQATDLAPVEIRHHGDDATIEMGEAVEPGAEAATEAKGERPKGAAAPQRPAKPLAEQDDLALPESAIATLGLAPGATGYVAIAGEYPDLIGYVEAKSGHRDGNEALRLTVDVETAVGEIAKRLPKGGGAAKAKPRLTGVKLGDDAAIEIVLGEKADEEGEKQGAYVRGAWRVAKLLDRNFKPDQIEVLGGGHGISLGPFQEPAGALGDRFDIEAPDVRKEVLGVGDGKSDVWLGAYYANDVLALTATAEKDKNEGLLGYVDVVRLLEQLKKLGAFGEKVLDAIGSALGAGVDKLKGFAAKLAAIAAKIGNGVLKIVGKMLQFRLPESDGKGGGWISWDLSLLAPNISLKGFSLEGLVPDFSNLRFPGLPGFSMSWLPKVDFDLSNPLGGTELDFGRLKKFFGGLDLPDVKFDFDVFGLDDWNLGIALDLSKLDLGDLFPGGHKLSFQLDLKRILGPLEKAWAWLKSKFPDGKPRKGSNTHVALGGDGVLRLWDDQAHIGFALTNLLDGFQAADVVPVEMSFQVTTGGKDGQPGDPLATLAYGQAVDKTHKAPADPEDGQVLAKRPAGKTMAEAKFDAPAMVREHLGAPKGADLDVDLIAVDDDTAALYATVTGTDRAMVLTIETARIQQLVKSIGPKAPSDLGGVKILWDECRKTKSIVIGFGEQPGEKTKQKDVKTHGHARWRMARFFDGLDLGDLVPDEAHLGMAEGGMSVGVGLDTKGLTKGETIDVPPSPAWLHAALGEQATVYSNADEKSLRIALLSAAKTEEGEAGPRRGIELDVATWFVDAIEAKVAEAAKNAGRAVGNALRKTAAAGARIGGDLSDKRISLAATPAGLRLQRGKDGEADHLYATFGWTGIVDAVTKQDLSGLTPVELRLATNSLALEIEDAKNPEGGMPADAKRVGGMHALFQDALGAFGLTKEQFLELDLGKSPIEPLPDGSHNVNLVGMIYTPAGPLPDPAADHAPGVAVADAQKVTLSVSLEALLAQVLPKKRAFANQKKNKKAKDGGTKMSIGYDDDLAEDEAGMQPGIGMHVESSHTSKKTGKTRTIKVDVGWTAEKLLNILMNLEDVGNGGGTDAGVGLLTPDVVSGSFENHLFKLQVGNRGEAVGHDIKCGDLPLLPEILGTFVDTKTANETVIWVEVPDPEQLASNFGKALLAGEYVKLGRAAIVMPGSDTIFNANLSISMAFFERLAGFIPYVGLALKIIRGVQSFLRDPKGTAESLLYTPEMLYHFVDNAGAIYDKLKGMSAKDIALAFMSNDASTKEAVYAARLKKKLEKAGIKLPDGKPSGPMPSEAELAWLNQQDPAAIAKAMELEKRLSELGLAPEEDPDAGPPTGKLDVAELETFQATIEAGFDEFLQARAAKEKNPDDPAAEAAVAAAAEKFRKQVAAHIAAGAKKMEREAPRTTDEKDLPPGEKQPAVSEDEALTRVSELPEPDPDRLAEAQEMFKAAIDGVDPTREAYLIQKFAILTTDQLADMLEYGTVEVDGKNGKMQLPLWDSERPFARALFLRRVKGMLDLKTPDGITPPAVDDKQLVTAYRNRNAKIDDQAKKDARKAAKEQAEAEKAAREAARNGGRRPGAGGAGGGKEETGEGAGNAEEEGSLDDSLWEDERAEEEGGDGGSGDTGTGLDKDGDGELSKEELADKGAEEGDKEAGEGGGDDAGTEPAEEAIDDTRLWTPSNNDAHAWMVWDEAAQKLVRNEERINAVATRGLQERTSTGEIATLTAIETEVGEDLGRGRKIIPFTITLVATTPSGKTLRSISYQFFHDVKAKETFQAGGGRAVIDGVHRAFQIKNDKVVLRGGPELIMGEKEFKVERIGASRKARDGYIFDVDLTAVAVPANSKVRNRDDQWQVINDGDYVEMTLPYLTETEPAAATE